VSDTEYSVGEQGRPLGVLLKIRSPFSLRNRLMRCAWTFVHHVLFRLSPHPLHAWRRFLLRCFGATVGATAHVYASAKIWAPWNLQMGEHTVLGPHVDCYCVAPIKIGDHTVISQYSFLCTASHDISHPQFVLTTDAIVIGSQVWIAADAFVGPGVTIGDGAVVGARSSVFRDVASWTVVAGNPARYLKKREIRPFGDDADKRNHRLSGSHSIAAILAQACLGQRMRRSPRG
jgi:putative colanic acid biosynthesis acetyltransferase WcaF